MKMYSLTITRVLIIFLSASLISCNDTAQPVEAEMDVLKNLVTVNFKQAWDRNDENAMAEMFLENADLTFPTSSWIKGRDAIRKAFTRDQPEGITGEFEVEDIRFLDPATAIVNVNAHFAGGKNKEGELMADYWDSATVVMKKVDGEWKYAALRVMPSRMDYSEVQASIRKSWDGFIERWEKGDAEGSANYFTRNAINMIPGNENNVNRTEILEIFKTFFAGNKMENVTVNTLELEIIGPKAYEHGLFEQKVIPKKGKPYSQKSRYYTVWQLEPDGVWRFHRFLFNNMP
ncbi:MAG: SgcJ/EcaC family oxidoreductase [Cyclobacteriaceae bacterium]